MRAIVFSDPGPPEVLGFSEVPEPVPGKGELLVRVGAVGLNRADLLQRMGLYPPPAGTRSDILGLECAGTVLESHDSASRFKPGDRVMAILPGEAYAEQVVIPANQALPVPDSLSIEEAAAIPEVFLTAYDALVGRLHLACGESLLIHAVGSGVGTAALQIARILGARVFGTAGSDDKLDGAKAFGLNLGINYRNESFSRALLEQGLQVDTILDLVGARHFSENLAVLRSQGRMVVVGLVSGRKAELDLGLLMQKRITLIGTVLRSRSETEKAALSLEFERTMLPLFLEGRLRPVVDRVFDWKEAAEAHRYMERNRNFGKIVLTVSRG
ncbi:MAG: NAD(P)H-quinone oxidoreductase [Acidobacteriota bacterium]|nr:MAG: NAD(P)H-quinone oxidoreductase [Acidobacteriota bacterium]